MKKIALLLVLMTTFLSCSVGDTDTYTPHFLAVETYTIPENLVVNQSYTISLTYQKPTACYNFRDVYIGGGTDGLTNTIAIYTDTKDGENCTGSIPSPSTVSIVFTPTKVGTYTFKFYKGADEDDEDDDGNTTEDLYEDVQVVVAAAS
ncbi:hypothetical protein [Flavobacterium flavipallidum]|uniref:CUB domain-containing protein n=1 Tax=Flavobacterium flavipallidum TaxID=3139140 RepID=A0ABU9HIM5_9FLAO